MIKLQKIVSIFILSITLNVFAQNDQEIIQKVGSEEIEESVPYSIVEVKPMYPGCEGNINELEICMETKIKEFVDKNFNKSIASEQNLKGVIRIITMFEIDKNGNVIKAQVRAPNKLLENEAKRVIGLLPKMIPGKQNGDLVVVKYSFSINFEVEVKYDKILEIEPEETGVVPFAIVNDKPIYPGCEGTNEEIKECFEREIRKFISSKFNLDITEDLALVGKQLIKIEFIIDQNGDVTKIRAKASHIKIEEEAIRVVGLLPKMIPAKYNNQPIGVKYTLPITFVVFEDK